MHPSENTPIGSRKNIPLTLLEQYGGSGCKGSNERRCYTRTQEVENLAALRYTQNHQGITYKDLLRAGVVKHKHQAQLRLKYCRNKGILFTLE